MTAVFQHLDDPAPLPPSTREQRQATVRRGESLRRRRRAKAFAAAVSAAAVIGAFAWSPALRGDTVVPPVVATPAAPSTATPALPSATVGPGRGTAVFWGSSPEVAASFTIPAGWATEGGWVYKSDAEVLFGVVFVDVANIFIDGCQWRLVQPAPGPTVEDLVSAYAKVPGSGAARDVTLDGFRGKQITHVLPDYNEADCREGRFGIFVEDNFSGSGPNLWAQTPKQRNEIRILDVDGTRLVIIASYPPKTSKKDRADLNAVITSIQIR